MRIFLNMFHRWILFCICLCFLPSINKVYYFSHRSQESPLYFLSYCNRTYSPRFRWKWKYMHVLIDHILFFMDIHNLHKLLQQIIILHGLTMIVTIMLYEHYSLSERRLWSYIFIFLAGGRRYPPGQRHHIFVNWNKQHMWWHLMFC